MKGFTMIKNFLPSLPERGKIKIGMKGEVRRSRQGNEFQLPQKLDHFRVTTMQRGQDGNFMLDPAVHDVYGEAPKELGVQLLYDDIELNFQCRYTCYAGRKQACSGDGERAVQATGQETACPCERQDPAYTGANKCKVNGCLSVIIKGAEVVGGVWKFRTTSYNSVVGILGSLSLVKTATGGPLAGIPLSMSLRPKTVVSPSDGATQTVYVVGLDYLGTFETLQALGYEIALNRQKHQIRMEDVEASARKLIAHTDQDYMDADTPDEFYPDQAAAAEGVPLAGGRKPVEYAKPDDLPADMYGGTKPVIPVEAGADDMAIPKDLGDSDIKAHQLPFNGTAGLACPADQLDNLPGTPRTAAEKIGDGLDEFHQKQAALFEEGPAETQEEMDELAKGLSTGKIPPPKENPPSQLPPTSGAGHDDWKTTKYMKSRKGNYNEIDPRTNMEFRLGLPSKWTGLAAYLRNHVDTWPHATEEQQRNVRYKWSSKTMFGTLMFPIAPAGHLICAKEDPKREPEETIGGKPKETPGPTPGDGPSRQEGEPDQTPGSNELTEHEKNVSHERLQILKAIVQNYSEETTLKAKKQLHLAEGRSSWPISLDGCIALKEACADIDFETF